MSRILIIDELKRKHSGVKIIAISGGGDIVYNQFLQAAALPGAHRRVHKPFEIHTFLWMVKDVLGESSAGTAIMKSRL